MTDKTTQGEPMPPAPVLSPDGRFWWDGTQWQPVPQEAARVLPSPPPSTASEPLPPGTNDAYVWVIALLPLLWILVDYVFPASDEVTLGIVVAVFFVNGFLAFLDARTLTSRGIKISSAWAWFVVPVYLISRTSTAKSTVLVPITWFVTFGVTLLLPFVVDSTAADWASYDCDQMATDVVAGFAAEDGPSTVEGLSIVEDRRSSLTTPVGTDESLVLSCSGLGGFDDGDQPILMKTTVDSNGESWNYYELSDDRLFDSSFEAAVEAEIEAEATTKIDLDCPEQEVTSGDNVYCDLTEPGVKGTYEVAVTIGEDGTYEWVFLG